LKLLHAPLRSSKHAPIAWSEESGTDAPYSRVATLAGDWALKPNQKLLVKVTTKITNML
jgi:hypothetical protein